ncbi:hypothetical protein BH10PSE2_BH10PSE2_25330 [soil metagenome]
MTNTKFTVRSTAVSVAALALAAIVGGSAMAQQVGPERQTPGRFAPADTDRDGRVSQAEFVQGRVARLTALDTNHDGSVSIEEMRAGRQAHRSERAEARFDRIDTDKNGQVSRAEFDAARGARMERPRGEGMGRMGQGGRGGEMGSRWGRHGGRGGMGHGPAERMAAHGPLVIADMQTRLTETFGKLDANHDGYVTPEERRAGMEAMRGQRREAWAARRQSSPSAPASE